MAKLLYIKASPRGAGSRSIAVADAYLARLRAGDAGLVVDEIDLWQENLPTFDGNKANAKSAVTKRIAPALIFAAMLGSLFTFLYVLLGLETYSLLAGTLALFVAVSVLMVVTQRVGGLAAPQLRGAG